MPTKLPDSRQYPRFAGVASFCRYPLLELVSTDCLPVDWALYGVPFDGGVTYRPGARFGPRAVREASQYVKRYSIEHDVDVCEVLSLADAGDAPVSPFDCRENAERVVEFASGVGDGDCTKLLAVGGDHSIAYANIKATWLRRGRPERGLALIHFDSHLDTVDSVWGERWGHASPFIRAIEEGLIDPARMISIGIKGPLNTKEDLDYAKTHGVEIITHADWQQDGLARLAAFVRGLGEDETYITFDIDCVDPAYAPGTGTLCPGGFTSAEVLGMLRSLAGVRVVGADVVEVLPDRDPAGITAFLAAHVVFEILCLDAIRQRG
ncbi:Guanidinobutyrase [hydrothermal vent metagenome]|uniref:Guanidinobutyrase n=1 Tax=hydrothermal vent metagenome TaxID=652676 RepID=A0A3B1DAG4_9ZZZZ